VTTVTPDLQLRTLFSLRPLARALIDSHRRVTATREPNARPASFFVLIRGISNVAWGVRNDVSEKIADELDRLAAEEPPVKDFRAPPIHADAYLSLVGGQVRSGPAFRFPAEIVRPSDVTVVDRLDLLERNFRGWTAAEIPWCSPIVAVMDSGYPVSVCFCATKNSSRAVEAGVETAAAFRRRGFAARVSAAWACAIRSSGGVPLYSTDWSNTASLAVARKLGLVQYASDWSLVEKNSTQGG
jgi:GNAT acetyltransferase